MLFILITSKQFHFIKFGILRYGKRMNINTKEKDLISKAHLCVCLRIAKYKLNTYLALKYILMNGKNCMQDVIFRI